MASVDVDVNLSPLAGGYGGLNGYWGQYGSEPLRDYCDSGIEYVTLSFVNVAPENNPSGYPGTNFAGHCWANTYSNKNNVTSQLLSHCQTIKTDIPYCQERGVKVLLSIGGDYSSTNDYEVTTEENGEDFADFLYKAFGPYDPLWDGPRPFDISETEHNAVNGFDFDIEAELDNKPYIAMIETLRTRDSSLVITGAPQCPTSDQFFYMKEMIQEAAFDALFIQFYNNPVCDTRNALFNYDEWESIVEQSSKSKNAKLYVGLPASSVAARTGYVDPEKVKDIVCQLKDKSHFAGISLWDLTRGALNLIDDKTFNEHVLDALQYGCDPIPTATSTVISSTATPISSDVSTPSASATDSTPTGDVSTPASTPTDASTSADPTPSGTTISSTDSSESISSGHVPSATVSFSTTRGWNTTFTTTAPDSDPTTTDGVELTTSTHFTTTTRTVTKCPPYVENCPEGPYVTTETIPLYTTVCPVTKTSEGAKPTSTKPATKWTTSTAYTTRVHTITQCPPEVKNCPEGPHETTETIPLYTTVCPVTKAAEKPEGPQPTASEEEPGKPGKPGKPGHGDNGEEKPGKPGQGESDKEVGKPDYDNSDEEQLSKPSASTTVYTTVIVPPKTLSTSSKPSAFTHQSNPASNSTIPAVPATTGYSGACEGAGCPKPPAALPSSDVPVTAGAASVAVGLSGLAAMVALQIFAL